MNQKGNQKMGIIIKILKNIETEIQKCGVVADDGSFASGRQQGLIDGLKRAREIIILGEI